MANEWDREHAQKRGGFTRFLTIDSALAESRLMTDPASGVDPECVFDQQWARTVLERTLARLREEYQSSGRAELFEQLAGSLSRESSAVPYSAIAERLHLTTAAVKMAVHRLRSRFRELLLVEVGGTVFNPEDARQEVHDLFAAFAG